MSRVINFNAGPAGLPLPALERARDEFTEFGKTGMSIMEHSHRGKDYEAVHNEAIALLKELLAVPDTHQILFMQGGAHLQFCTIPMNFLPAGKTADYVITGNWANVALNEAKKAAVLGVGKVNVAADTQVDKKWTRVPKAEEIKLTPDAAYVHTTSNNTIFGTQFQTFPDFGKVPHICDMSSDFLSRKLDISKFAMIYAGAQKNIGPSGVVVCIMSKDLIASGRKDLPKTLTYSVFAENNSLFNTPPTFAIYMVRNVLAWMKEIGGIDQMQKRNEEKGQLLYGTIEKLGDYYKSPVEKESRSLMNIVFRLPNEGLEEKFIAEAKKAGMVGLKGHRSVGGIRVSAYNAVSVDDIKTLCGFMEKFAADNKA